MCGKAKIDGSLSGLVLIEEVIRIRKKARTLGSMAQPGRKQAASETACFKRSFPSPAQDRPEGHFFCLFERTVIFLEGLSEKLHRECTCLQNPVS